jgi:catechol 2,3-dioxygenase-like lactoylglutathione lyase family enzyme
MRATPMLQVDDVAASSRWYQRLLGLVSGHGGAEYEMLFAGPPFASPLLLQLHRWDAHEHGFLGSPDRERGNGVSLWFEVADRAALDAAWARAGDGGVAVLEAPHWNPLAHHHEFTVRDPDGYVVVIATPFEPVA